AIWMLKRLQTPLAMAASRREAHKVAPHDGVGTVSKSRADMRLSTLLRVLGLSFALAAPATQALDNGFFQDPSWQYGQWMTPESADAMANAVGNSWCAYYYSMGYSGPCSVQDL